MKKSQGLYLLTIGSVIFICYFLGAAIYATGGTYNTLGGFFRQAWVMLVFAAAFAGGGLIVFFRSKE